MPPCPFWYRPGGLYLLERGLMRTAIAILLGGWLLGTLLLGGVASENFFMIDRLISSSTHPSFQKDVAQLPPGEARTMMRYLSSELNRFYFGVGGWVELILGVLVLGLAVAGLRQRKFILGFSLMLAIVALMVLNITPKITQVGRSLDFVPRQPSPPGMAEFGMPPHASKRRG